MRTEKMGFDHFSQRGDFLSSPDYISHASWAIFAAGRVPRPQGVEGAWRGMMGAMKIAIRRLISDRQISSPPADKPK